MMKRITKINKVNKYLQIFMCAVLLLIVSGCTSFSDTSRQASESNDTQAETTEELTSESDKTEEKTSESDKIEEKTSEENATEESSEETTENVNTNEYKEANSDGKSEADSADNSVCYPEYIGDAYVELNDNIPLFTDEEKKSTTAFEEYSDLDKLGRCGVAFANICPELMPTEERGEIGSVKPSGWHTVKYPEIIEDNYLYNRSHLIAYSLAGENANEKNLITGTRYLNQETMQIFELRVLDYVRDSGNHVLYRVTPVFEADNLLASGVQMEAWSVEDSGKGICFNVFCYNVQPGIDIDYATGDSRVAEEASSESKVTEDTNVQAATESTTETTVESSSSSSSSDFADQERTYILNTNTKKVHLPDCRSVKDMADHNKEECVGTLNDIKNKGYTPCKKCLAQY